MKPEHLQEDLKMEVIAAVCEWPEEKIVGLHERKELEFYVARVIINQIQSNTSPFYKKYRSIHTELDDKRPGYIVLENDIEPDGSKVNSAFRDKCLNRVSMLTDISPDITVTADRETRERLEDIALEEIDSLYWYDAELVRLYMRFGNYRAIEKETGIAFESCYKTIRRAIKTLKERATDKLYNPVFNKSEINFIQNCKA